MKILLTGSQGFIGSYICNELLSHGYEVIGADDFSKYGKLKRSHDYHKNFTLYEGTIGRNDNFLNSIAEKERPDMIIASCAMIGGIQYFHKFAYDLLATNERIMADTYDAAIKAHKDGYLKRVIVLSSSMVFERSTSFPVLESDIKSCGIPMSTYGFQKLATEFFAKGAWEQYGVPYTILRPFNCVGIGEEDSISEHEITSGNIKLMLSHVLPDLINKCLKGQDPLHILGEGNQVRCYTNGKDLAMGIRLAIESNKAINEDFNISTPTPTTVLELAELIWNKINPYKPFSYVSDPAFEYDVQKRIPDVTKAREILGFESEISLDESIDEVIDYMRGRCLYNLHN
jgi:UDP-glucose 4-epimerase